MKKMLTTALSAILCVSCFSASMTAFAETDKVAQVSASTGTLTVPKDWKSVDLHGIDDLAAFENGDAQVERHYQLGRFLVVTDENGLEEGLFGSCTVYETGENPEECTWMRSLPDELQKDTGLRYYIVDGAEANTWQDGDLFLGATRALMLSHSEIKSILNMQIAVEATAVWDGDFIGMLADGTEVDSTSFAEYAQIQEEIQALRDTGVQPYELLVAAQEKADVLRKANQEKCHLVFPSIECTPILETAQYSCLDAWACVGDVNGLNGINAADAAQVLIAAASEGAGNGCTLSYEAKQYADVNADGNVNAADAAIILIYAARIGSGDDIQIKDLISK